MYHSVTSSRDVMRNTAMSLHMADFPTAWRMLNGKEESPPKEVKELTATFDTKAAGRNRCRPGLV